MSFIKVFVGLLLLVHLNLSVGLEEQQTTTPLAATTDTTSLGALGEPSVPIGLTREGLEYPTLWYERSSLLVDLSYPLNSKSIALADHRPFQLIVDHDGFSQDSANRSYYWKIDSISTSTHTGTHIDAPLHFYQNRWAVDEIPLPRLVGVPVVVVDLSEKVRQNRAYLFQPSDFWNVDIRARSVVLVYTGISDDYKHGARTYYGMREAGNEKSTIPGFGNAAAKYLVSRGVYGVGLDAPSADNSDNMYVSGSFNNVAHMAFCQNNVYILENLNTNLKLLTRRAGRVELYILPLPITSGSGSPVRVLAIRQNERGLMSSAPSLVAPNLGVLVCLSTLLSLCFLSALRR